MMKAMLFLYPGKHNMDCLCDADSFLSDVMPIHSVAVASVRILAEQVAEVGEGVSCTQ
jgi:hypothetical protein